MIFNEIIFLWSQSQDKCNRESPIQSYKKHRELISDLILFRIIGSMVSFARARTRSLLSRLWPMKSLLITNTNDNDLLDKSQELIKKQKLQDKYFLEASKNGGMWFS